MQALDGGSPSFNSAGVETGQDTLGLVVEAGLSQSVPPISGARYRHGVTVLMTACSKYSWSIEDECAVFSGLCDGRISAINGAVLS